MLEKKAQNATLVLNNCSTEYYYCFSSIFSTAAIEYSFLFVCASVCLCVCVQDN